MQMNCHEEGNKDHSHASPRHPSSAIAILHEESKDSEESGILIPTAVTRSASNQTYRHMMRDTLLRTSERAAASRTPVSRLIAVRAGSGEHFRTASGCILISISSNDEYVRSARRSRVQLPKKAE